MKFIEVTEMGKKYYINVNKILFVHEYEYDDKKSKTRIIIDAMTTDGNDRIKFYVEEPYNSIINMIYLSDE